MGISGLLPFLKDASTSVNIRDYTGCTVAIDTYCWIYRGAFSCAEDLAMNTQTDGFVNNFMLISSSAVSLTNIYIQAMSNMFYDM
jgi:hypothetical protein